MKGRSASKIKLTSYDELLGGGEETNDIQQVSLEHLHSFENHPFQVNDDEAMAELVESVKEEGILTALLVRPLGDGEYEIIAGHRRRHAAQLAGLKEVPVIIRNMDQDTAVRAMVDSNLQRPNILPSEKAFAYKMKLEALTHQGKRTDLTSAQLGEKLESKYSVQLLAEEVGDSKSQVQRFIRLTELIPELLDLVDEKQIALSPAVELSFLKDEEQYAVLDCIECNVATPSHAQAIRLKKMSQEGTLTTDEIEDILSEEKPNQIPKMKFNADRIRNVLPKNIEEKKIEDFVVNAIEFYGKHLQRQKSMDAR